MIDGIKSLFLAISIENLLKNHNLDFQAMFSCTYGDVKEYQPIKAFCRGLIFAVVPVSVRQRRCQLNGSLHRYFNGIHNGDDFSIADLLVVLDDLAVNFGVDLFESAVNNVEFGVNVYLPFPVKTVLDSLICLNGVRFEKTVNSDFDYYQAMFSQHIVKLYDKGRQVKDSSNILRVEFKAIKMQYLQARGINIRCLADLVNPQNLLKMGEILDEIIAKILFDELSINQCDLSNDDRILYLEGRCNKNWLPIVKKDFVDKREYNCQRKRQQRNEERFRLLVEKCRREPNWRNELLFLVNKKWNNLITLPDDWVTTYKSSVDRWRLVSKDLNHEESLI